ncbi:adaptin N terminal region-domain-containing protein [Amylostereum chailletii]|nr:adaptin N terminal region-domain-containing protein [Amylostereum chailletii]
MWERTLQDLIRGLRANKSDESKFIAQAVDEIRREVKSKDMELKAAAILKLTYLDMLGHDMSWASFHIVEVMSSPKYHLKTVGYLAATQSFGPDTDVIMLTTNLLKKDLTSSPGDIAISTNGLSHIVTPDLARDLAHDLVSMLNHSRPNIRKRAVIAVYKMLVKYPQAAPLALGRLKEKLNDTDPGMYLCVVAATVNVLCELVRQTPADYLELAPQLFHLLTTSSNNWMLIKLIKLFGFLSPHEPRLVKKLQPPITDLITTTPAISLLYECVHTCIVGGMLQTAAGHSLADTCVTKLATFLQDSDQNLKYIALLALVKIVPSHPHLVAKYQDMILASVNDQDISIRMRALDLLTAMVTPDNIQSIVQQLLSHLVRPEPAAVLTATQSLSQNAAGAVTEASLNPVKSSAYRLTLSQRILSICSEDTYRNITDFQWYLSVLVDLAYVAGVDVGIAIRDQLVDVVGRVRAVRRKAVELMVSLLSDEAFALNAREDGSCAEVLWAAAWICGEHSGELAEPNKLIPFLLQPHVYHLSSESIGVYLQAVLKIFGLWASDLAHHWDNDDLSKVKLMVDEIVERMVDFASSPDIEAANTLQLLTFVRADLAAYRPKLETLSGFESPEPTYPKSLLLIRPLFTAYDLNPVHAAAQSSIPPPELLDLDTWIVPPPRENRPAPSSLEVGDDSGRPTKKKGKGKGKAKDMNGIKTTSSRHKSVDDVAPVSVETAEERAQREREREARLERQRDDPYYIGVGEPSKLPNMGDIDSIPVVHLDDLPPMPQASTPRLPTLLRSSASNALEPMVIDKDGEMPEGIRISLPPSQPPSQRPSHPPTPLGNGITPVLPSPFAEYVVEDEEPRTSTPEPIRVTRAKKNGTSGKKKRTKTNAATKIAGNGDETPSHS